MDPPSGPSAPPTLPKPNQPPLRLQQQTSHEPSQSGNEAQSHVKLSNPTSLSLNVTSSSSSSSESSSSVPPSSSSSSSSRASTKLSHPAGLLDFDYSAYGIGIGSHSGGKKRCFDPAAFAQKTFGNKTKQNSNGSVRKGKGAGGGGGGGGGAITLNTLHVDLLSYQSELQGELVELLNREYSDFIGLSSSLMGVENCIVSCYSALEILNKKFQEKATEIQEIQENFEYQLISKQNNENKKLYLQMLFTIHNKIKVLQTTLNNQKHIDVQTITSQQQHSRSPSSAIVLPEHVDVNSYSIATRSIVTDLLKKYQTITTHSASNPPNASSASGPSDSEKSGSVHQDLLSQRESNELAEMNEVRYNKHVLFGNSTSLKGTNTNNRSTQTSGNAAAIYKEQQLQLAALKKYEIHFDMTETTLDQDYAWTLFQTLLNQPNTSQTYAGSSSASSRSSASFSEIRCLISHNLSHLERFSRLLNELKILINKCSSFLMIQSLIPGFQTKEMEFEKKTEEMVLTLFQLHAEEMKQSKSSASHPVSSSSSTTINRLNFPLFQQLLRIYSFSDKMELYEQMVREKIIRPLFQDILNTVPLIVQVNPALKIGNDPVNPAASATPATANGTAAAGRTNSHSNLLQLYQSWFDAIQGPLAIFLQCAYQTSCSPPVPPVSFSPFFFNFLGNCLCRELSNTLIECGSTLFAPGIPLIFHLHYLQTKTFLSAIEQFATNPFLATPLSLSKPHAIAPLASAASISSLLSLFRAHPTYVSLSKKWNLSIYFQLRFQQIANYMEHILSTSTTHILNTYYQQHPSQQQHPHASSSSDSISLDHTLPTHALPLSSTSLSFCLLPSQYLWECFHLCFSPQVYLDEIAARFLKLALQIFIRYTGWIENGMKTVNVEKIMKEKEKEQQQQASASSGGDDPSWSSAAPAPSSVSDDSKPEFPLHLLILLQTDILRLLEFIPNQLLPLIQQRIHKSAGTLAGTDAGPSSNNISSTIESLFAPSLTRLSSLLPTLSSLSSLYISSSCCCLVKISIPRLKSAFLVSGKSKKIPTHPSNYVKYIFYPLISIIQQLDQGKLESMKDNDPNNNPMYLLQEAMNNAGAGNDSNPAAANSSTAHVGLVPSASLPPSPSSCLLPFSSRHSLLVSVVQHVTTDVIYYTNELLNIVTKTEASLKRLTNKRPPTGSASGSGAADKTESQKIRLQLELDLTEYRRIIIEQLNIRKLISELPGVANELDKLIASLQQQA